MRNRRISELDVFMQELEGAGIAIVKRPEWDTAEGGRFVRTHDREGNPIELWEPPRGQIRIGSGVRHHAAGQRGKGPAWKGRLPR